MSRKLLSDRVYRHLLNRLLRNKLRPGDVISHRDLADSLGVSTAPVRDAIVQLESDGYLVSLPRKGTMVRQIDNVDVWGCLVMREAIEVQAARIYCGPPIVAKKDRLLEMAQAIHRPGIEIAESWAADIEFHRALIKLTECPRLIQSFDEVMQHARFHEVNQMVPPAEYARDTTYRRDHVMLLELLSTAAPDRAAQYIYDHVHQRLAVAERDPNIPWPPARS